MSASTVLDTLRNSSSHRIYVFAVIRILLAVCLVAAYDDQVCGYCGVEGPLIVVGLFVLTDVARGIWCRRRGLDPVGNRWASVAAYALMALFAVGLGMVAGRGRNPETASRAASPVAYVVLSSRPSL